MFAHGTHREYHQAAVWENQTTISGECPIPLTFTGKRLSLFHSTRWNRMEEPSIKAGNSRFLSFVCVAVSLGMLFAGLWPFRFRPSNQVHRFDGQPGLRFGKFGIVHAMEPFFGPGGAIDPAKPFTIRMEVRPHEEPSTSLPRILSAHDEDGRELLFIGQWRDQLILGVLAAARTVHPGYREYGAGGLRKDVVHSIAVRSDVDGVTLSVDGAEEETAAGVGIFPPSYERKPAWLILGNSPAGDSPWRGDLLSLSFSPGAFFPGKADSPAPPPVIRYDFSEGTGAVCRNSADSRYDLRIPDIFRAPKKAVLLPPWRVQRHDRSFWRDVFANILGFIPFGFAVYARTWKGRAARGLVSAVLLGAGISLLIELLQVWIPGRNSSLTDFLTNVLGTYLGTWLFRVARNALYR